MKVLLTGASGQLGTALIAQKPKILLGKPIELITTNRSNLDLADSEACRQIVESQKPNWVVNAGAYTAVDQAENEPDLAYAVNAGAPAAFVEALGDYGGRLLQISTDFVFNGNLGFPYKVDAQADPLSVYAFTKLQGEVEAQKLPGARLLRTSWVYGPMGKNFFLTMLQLHAKKAAIGESIGVVADQVGCPTATYTLAAACWRTLAMNHLKNSHRTLHWSDAGVSSWYDFAVAIGELGVKAGLLKKSAVVRPISTLDYPTPAKRPSYSLLDCLSSYYELGLQPVHWRTALIEVIRQFAQKTS